MKFIKRLLGFLVLLVLLGLIAGFLAPKNIEVEQSIDINALPKVVYDQVNNLENYNKWSPWNERDPNIKIDYSRQLIGKGAQFTWDSEKRNVGSGSLSILESQPYESLETELNFGNRGMGYGNWTFTETEEGTNATWGFKAEIGNNPVGRLMGLIMKSSMKNSFSKGLNNIKTIAESIKDPIIEVSEVDVPETWALCLKAEPLMADDAEAIYEASAEIFEDLTKYMKRKKFEALGPPLCIYHTLNKEQVEFSCGIPVKKGTRPSGNFKLIPLEGAAFTSLHKGDYADLPKTYDAFEMWLADQGKAPQGLIWEQYLSDPELETDPENWETQVYYMLE